MTAAQPRATGPIVVDDAICASFGRCHELEPLAVVFDESDQAVPTPQARELSEERIRALIDICPTGAIRRAAER